ncbi:hypothetical protein C0Q70_09233 [Pomacea canaliculata]|uniref:Phosphoinositide phospholipase C n=1 Tax=Pomacea canaliculata TaxID=400727 RepID=A0A2T7P976_POMCA|nr:hypothetical protein C0Q70_09233 [Pomacea canaliculata]
MMRTYPAGMRIDSSNFNPVIFWAFGIQMVALNYQTEDTAIALNTAMFEQNGRCGYVLKPSVMWDKSHVMYNHFNPWDKEFEGLHATIFTLHVISGQYVCNSYTANVQVEVEVIGIPVDCAKQKTKVVPKNALNPIWNDIFTFQIMFADMAFLRFMVIDTNTGHMVSQRVVSFHSLRPGYRHLRLRSPSNQPCELATLFIYSKTEEDILEARSSIDISQTAAATGKRMSLFTKVKELSEASKEMKEVPTLGPKLKRRLFFISVFGLTGPDEYVILKVTQESTVYDVIAQALLKVQRLEDKIGDYMLVEDVQSGWEKKDQEKASTQRILDITEKVLQAQNKWKGAGRFILRKLSDDPTSRAWVTTMLKEQKRKLEMEQEAGGWEVQEKMFHVCVYNVSPDQPYTVFKAPSSSTALDVITQAMKKTHRAGEDPRSYVLVEELDIPGQGDTSSLTSRRPGSEKVEMRILADDENVHDAQCEWRTTGRFILMPRDAVPIDNEEVSKYTAGLSISRSSGFVKRFGSKRISSKHQGSGDKLMIFQPTPETVRRSISFPSQVNSTPVVAAAMAPQIQLQPPPERQGTFKLKHFSKISFKRNK